MLHTKTKIINDPIYGFLRFDHTHLLPFMEHPLFQRLRRIKQMGMAHFVYPGAVHTRFHHSLGATHLMQEALNILKQKKVAISNEDFYSAQQAILYHDIGHGPFSHALEYSIVNSVSHEQLSLLIMDRINEEVEGKLTNAISIFKNEHPIPFLHQLISGQLDMDRMDYLNRDSFYSGVYEGVIGYDRILEMLNVHNNNLVVEEKGIHSVEKFIIARRLMYWQVYLHKTVISAECLMINILKRAKELAEQGRELFSSPDFKFFLYEKVTFEDFSNNKSVMDRFCNLDDSDITASIKAWANSDDKILSKLCSMLLERKLYKIKLSTDQLDQEYNQFISNLKQTEDVDEKQLSYFTIKGTTANNTYSNKGSINILYKDGQLLDITEVDNALISKRIAKSINKFYFGMLKEWRPYNK